MKSVLTALLLLALAAPAHAWTIRTACDSPGSYLHNVGTSTAALYNSVWDIIPHAAANGEDIHSAVNLVAPFDFVGSLVCLGFSDLKDDAKDEPIIVIGAPVDAAAAKAAAPEDPRKGAIEKFYK